MALLEDFLTAAAGAGGYQPSNLSPEQINQESGGQQFNKDGTTKVSSAGAVGKSQILPSTAQDYAKRHGLTVDVKKLSTDANYNTEWGDKYQGELNQQFGAGTPEALAAYNAGPGNGKNGKGVLGAKQRAAANHDADNWFDYLPDQTQDYVNTIRSKQGLPTLGNGKAGGLNSSITGGGLDIPPIMRDQGSTGLPSGSAATVANPFDAGPGIAGQLKTTADRAKTSDDILSQAVTALQGPGGIDEQRQAALNDRNQVVGQVNDEGIARTRAVLARLAPIQQQREAVADQITKVENMNPLVRGIKSLFDASYDSGHLKNLDADLANQAQTYGDDYKQIMDAQGQLVSLVNSNYNNKEMDSALKSGFIDEKIKLASQSFAAADNILSTSLKGIGAQSTLLAAQNQLKDTVLTQMTPGQRATGLNQLRASGEQAITIQGASFTEGDLLAANQADASNQMRLDELAAQRQAAVANANATTQRLADEAEKRVIGGMTTAQQRMAIQNGGMWQGQKLSLDVLGAGLQDSMARDKAVAQGTMVQGATQQWVDTVSTIRNVTNLGSQRAMQLTGVAPKALQGVIATQNSAYQQMNKALQAAKTPEERDLLATTYLPQIQKMGQDRQKAIDSVAESWAGGSKMLLPLAQAFLAGQPLNSASAVKGLIVMARNNANFGANMSQPAVAALAAVKAEIAASQVPDPNNPYGALLDSKTAAQKELDLESKITADVNQVYGQKVFDNAIDNAPAIAKNINHLGQFLNPDILHQATSLGDLAGYKAMAPDMGGVTPEQVQAAFTAGPKSQQWALTKVDPKLFDSMNARLQTAQLQSAYQYLDAHHPKIGKFTASQVYANLLGSQQFAVAASNLQAAHGQSSFGDFVMGGLGATDIQAQVSQFGDKAKKAHVALGQAEASQKVAMLNRWGDPGARLTATLAPILNNTKEEDALVKAVSAAVPPDGDYGSQFNELMAGAPGIPQNSVGLYRASNVARFMAMTAYIKDHKFDDPSLERIRKHVAGKIDDYSATTDKALARLQNYSPEQ